MIYPIVYISHMDYQCSTQNGWEGSQWDKMYQEYRGKHSVGRGVSVYRSTAFWVILSTSRQTNQQKLQPKILYPENIFKRQKWTNISGRTKAEAVEIRLGSSGFLVVPFLSGPNYDGLDTPLSVGRGTCAESRQSTVDASSSLELHGELNIFQRTIAVVFDRILYSLIVILQFYHINIVVYVFWTQCKFVAPICRVFQVCSLYCAVSVFLNVNTAENTVIGLIINFLYIFGRLL